MPMSKWSIRSPLRAIQRRSLSSERRSLSSNGRSLSSKANAQTWTVPSQARLAMIAAAAITVGVFAVFPLLVQPPIRKEKPAVASILPLPSRNQLQNASPEAARKAFSAAIKDLRKALAEDCFLPEASRGRMSDHTVVISPRTAEDVSTIVKAAAKHCILVTSRTPSIESNATKKEEDALSMPEYAISLDFATHMSQIIKSDRQHLVVQPGFTLNSLTDLLRKESLSLTSKVTLSNDANMTFSSALNQGIMREGVSSLKVVLPNGDVLSTASEPSSGPNLTSLFLGTEGSLGLIVEAHLKVRPMKAGKDHINSDSEPEDSTKYVKVDESNAMVLQRLKAAFDPQGIFGQLDKKP